MASENWYQSSLMLSLENRTCSRSSFADVHVAVPGDLGVLHERAEGDVEVFARFQAQCHAAAAHLVIVDVLLDEVRVVEGAALESPWLSPSTLSM